MPNRGNKGRRRMGRAGNQGSASKLGNTLQAPLKVFLKLTWLDPTSKKDAPKKRSFPKDLPLTLTWGDGDPERVTVGDDGLVKFEMGPTNARARKTFLLTFALRGAKRFILCEKEGDPEETKFGELPKADDKGVVPGRVFALPQRFTTRASDWKADDAHPDKDRFTPAKGSFALLSENKPKDIGTQDKPLEVTLDPHWQYLRVEFFDRYYGHSSHSHKPVTVPALMFEGHRYARLRPKDEHKAETESNWTLKRGDHEALVQCVPWILRKNLDSGHEDDEEKKPDRESLLLFRTKEKTFVKSTSATARALSVETGDLKLDADRLKLYDLPQLWMSRNQFAWLGESDEERGWFQDLAAKETTLDKPLCVSLDDIVLVRIEAGEQRPIDAQGVDLPTVFFHSFKEATGGAGGRDAATYSKEGIYKPGRTLAKAKALAKKAAEHAKSGEMRLEKRRVAEDGKRTAARAKPTTEESKNHAEHSRRKEILAEGTKKEDEFIKAGTDAEVTTAGANAENGFEATAVYPFSDIVRPKHLPVWHIVDYPHWTRLVLCQGDLFDVFDQRTHQDLSKADDAKLVVGARAAVRWYDRTNWVAAGTVVAAQPTLVRHPSAAASPSFALQPYFQQEYHSALNVFGGSTKIGRNDLALLRACDHDGDTEVAVTFQYVKLNFTDNSGGANLEQYQNKIVQNVIERYHGDDGRGLSVRPEFHSRDNDVRFRALYTMFLQVTERARAHYAVSIEPVNRAWANGVKGTAALGPAYFDVNGPDVRFSSAHETGHFISLPDDYGETASYGSYGHLDFTENTPGLPFDLDTQAMMRSNRQPRARNFWFAAEWVRDLLKTSANLNGVPLKVWHGGRYPNFTLPRHASRPMRCYANIPVAKAKVNGPDGGASCVYLYRFGKDKTTEDILPAYFGGAAVDGAVIVTVRVYVRFCVQVGPDRHFVDDSGASQDLIDNILPLLRSAVETDFNKKWIATGNFTTEENETINFTRCMVHFQARLLVANYGDPDTVEGLTGKKTSGDYANHVAAVRNTIAEHHTLEILPKLEAGHVTTFTGGGTNDLFLADTMSEDEIRADFSTFLRKSMGFTVSPVPLGELQTLVRSVFPNAVVALK